jgi:phosphinothricin acetyltransferase
VLRAALRPGNGDIERQIHLFTGDRRFYSSAMPAPEIRPATEADLPAITEIYEHAVRHGTATFELISPDLTEMTRRFKTLTDGGYPYLAAALDGRVIGYAYAGPYRPRPAYRFSVEDSIYIDPHAQRRGVGRVLLEHLIEECERRGFRQMIAVIGDSAQAPSIELHRALGFRMIGAVENVGYKFGRWLDSVNMQRALGAGATTKPD